MKKDVLLWAALVAALTVTASAEYELARAAGFGVYVAGGVPAALDIYAVRALRARRDVPAVVLAMVAVNAASHLVVAGLLPVSVPLVVAVSSIAPLVLWRVHRLAEHIHTEPAPAVEVHTEPVPQHPVAAPAPAKEPEVICGAGQVHTVTVPPAVDPAEVNSRLDAEQARMVIEYAWASGLSVREAARVSTRSPSFAAKVYTALEREHDAAPDRPALEAVSA